MKSLCLDCDRRLLIVGTMLAGMVMLLPTKPALAHPGHGVFIQSLAEQSLTPTMTLTGLGVAFLFGTGHALAPGHGKTMVAAYYSRITGNTQTRASFGLSHNHYTHFRRFRARNFDPIRLAVRATGAIVSCSQLPQRSYCLRCRVLAAR